MSTDLYTFLKDNDETIRVSTARALIADLGSDIDVEDIE